MRPRPNTGIAAKQTICAIVSFTDAGLSDLSPCSLDPQLGTSLILGTSDVKKPAISKVFVGAVGIELKATLKIRKLLILLNEKNAKNTEFTQLRYTPGTRRR